LESKGRARTTLVTCCGTHVLHDGLSDVLYVLLPVLAQTFGLSLAQAGLIRSVHRTSMSLFQIPAGALAEKLGERGLLVLATGVAGVAFLGLGFTTGFMSVLMLLFIAGFGAAFQHPLCATIVSRAYAGGGRRGALGTYNFAGDVGKLGFAGVASLLLAAGFGWQQSVIGFGVLTVAGAGLIFLVLNALGVGTRPEPVTTAGDADPVAGWGIHDRMGFGALSAIAVVDSLTRSGFLTFVAFLMIAKGLSEEMAVLAIPAIFLGGTIGKLVCGFIAERIGIIRTVLITEIGTGLGILLLLVLPAWPGFVLMPLLGMALNGTSSVLYGTVGELVRDERHSRAFGLFYTVTSGCGIAAPLGFGLLGDVIGIAETIAVIGVMVFLTVPLAMVLGPSISGRVRAESPGIRAP
jgi:MFS family permease